MPAQPGTVGTKVVNPVISFVPTCGGGSSATTATPFEGQCGWNESGIDCGTPWGPIPKTKKINLNNCEGSCG